MPIEKKDLLDGLVSLFEAWIKPHIQFSTNSQSVEGAELHHHAVQFYVLNCFACEMAGITPKELVDEWSKRMTLDI